MLQEGEKIILTRIVAILSGSLGLIAGTVAPAAAAEPFTINDAIIQAVRTHPGVGEAAANRRATESELRQTQTTLLPQVRLEARTGRTRYNFQDSIVPPKG